MEQTLPGSFAQPSELQASWAESEQDPVALLRRYREVRRLTESLVEPLTAEDQMVQSMSDASPAKWHLAHTTWFFETFVFQAAWHDYRPAHPQYGFLFNSYYNALGDRIPRAQRGMISRPTVEEVFSYRRHVDDHMAQLLDRADEACLQRLAPVLTLGLHHEQQHQELILTDIKHAFSCNPLRPVYRVTNSPGAATVPSLRWKEYPAGLREIGHDGKGFAYDNESPRHQQFVHPFRLASRLVTNGEFLAFIEDSGYHRPELWLSDGWDARRTFSWLAPLYWVAQDGAWCLFTLGGMQKVNPAEPVCHLSYFEADAFARWAKARLPTEFEWEVAATHASVTGNLLETGRLHPAPLGPLLDSTGPAQMFGDVWEWTTSPYIAYPGYRPTAGALGEYNGKFMCNQMVLRGGSCATPPGHVRLTYRNFFPPPARWQFTGIRLAEDV